MKKSFNGNIEVIRWLLTFMVATMHLFANNYESAGIFEGWYIAVDFFFVISGLFLAASFEKVEQHPVMYTLRRWGGMFWIYETSLLFSIIIHGKLQPVKMGDWLIKCIPDFLGIQMTGLFKPHLNEIVWYISALLISSLVLGYVKILIKNDKLRNSVLLGIIVVFYAYIFKEVGNLDAVLQQSGIGIPLGILRGIAGMSVGVLIYTVACRSQISGKGKIWSSIVEIISIALLLYCAIKNPHSNYDFYSLIAIPAVVFVAWKQSAIWGKPIDTFGNWLVRVFGKNMTLAMYTYSGLVYVVLRVIIPFAEENRHLIALLYTIALVVVGFIISKLSDFMNKKCGIKVKGEWVYDSKV